MNVQEYINYLMIEKTDVTEFELGKILGLEFKDFPDLESYTNEVNKRIKLDENYQLPKSGELKFNGKFWWWDENISNTTIEQWAIMSEELSRGLEINTRLVAIYFRPVGEQFNVERLEEISNEILEMDINIFMAINKVFFYQGMKLSNNMTHRYLNQKNHPKGKLRLILYGGVTDGIYRLKNWLEIIFYKLRKFIKFR